MNSPSAKLLIIFLCIMGTAFMLGIFNPPDNYERRGLAKSINARRIKEVELGFTQVQVESSLGAPLEFVPDAGNGLSYLFYSRSLRYTFTQPRVWIVLKNRKVVAVRVQRMTFWGDEFDYDYYNKHEHGTIQSPDFEEYFR